jgi:hypothetical protein
MNSKTDFYIYTLGRFYLLYRKKISPDMLEVAVNKVTFINILRKASISKLSPRMIYRHLEYMENSKLIKYNNKKLQFTKKGHKHFLKIRNRFEDYFRLGTIMSKKDISKYSKKSQTHFKKKAT